MSRFILIVAPLLLACSGCYGQALALVMPPEKADTKLRFDPNERITAENADRLELVFAGRFATIPNYHQHNGGRPRFVLHAVAIDGEKRTLRVAFDITVDDDGKDYHPRKGGSPLETYDLRTGEWGKSIRVPMHPDLSGSHVYSGYDGVFCLNEDKFLTTIYLPKTDVRRPILLDINRDAPTFAGGPADCMIKQSRCAPTTAMLVTMDERAIPTHVVYIDVRSGAVVRRVAMPEGATRDLKVRGGNTEFVAAVDTESPLPGGKTCNALCLYSSKGDRLEKVAEHKFPQGVTLNDVLVDWKRGLVAVAGTPPIVLGPNSNPAVVGADGNLRCTVFALDDLRVVREISVPDSFLPKWNLQVEQGWILQATATGLFVFDIATGRTVAKLNTSGFRNDDYGPSFPIADDGGRFIGFYGSHWIQLYAVKPKTGDDT